MRKIKRLFLIIVILISIAIFTIFASGYVRYRQIILETPLETKIAEIKQQEDYVTLDEIHPDFLNAILAVEDPKFYQHQGVLLSNIIEAFFTNLKEQEYAMGGSTITQQLCKNLFLDQKKTLHRKVAELFFVHDVEQSLSKNEILELYVNIIYFGDGYYGIKQASLGYFQTDPKDLTIAQASLLAGLPQAPAIYQLSTGYTLAKQRQRIVLEEMVTHHYLQEEDIPQILQQPLS